jgi:uncharacterized protein YrrD
MYPIDSGEANMITSQTYSNKPLIRVTDGKKLGEVKDIYLDRDLRQLAAVFLGTEGFFNRNAQVVGRSAVQVYGIDAWIVSGEKKWSGWRIFPTLMHSSPPVNCAAGGLNLKVARRSVM